MDVLSAKITAMFLLGGISWFLGLLPLLLKKCCNIGAANQSSKAQYFLSALACFGGGVILTTCFTHMLPEVNLFLQKNIREGHFPNTGMPIAEILVLCGFFMVYIVEEVTHIVVDKLHKSKVSDVNGRIAGQIKTEDHEAKQALYDHGGHPHVHEEVPIDLLILDTEHQFQAALRGFLVILALSLHAVFEGIALGLTHTTSSVWFLFFAIASHKYVISFCVGMQFVSSGVTTWLMVIYVSTFALISPVGAGIGIALSETVENEAALQNSLVTILQGLATGTLLYVVFFEVIEKERLKGTNGILQVTFIVAGFICMILLELIELSTHTEPNVAKTAVQNICTLIKIESSWTYPMNFTCIDNTYLSPTST